MGSTQIIRGGDRHQLEGGARLVVIRDNRIAPGFHQDIHAGAAQRIYQIGIVMNRLRQIVQTAFRIPCIRNFDLDVLFLEDFLNIFLEFVDILFARQLVGIVRIKVRQVGHCQYLTGLDVHNDAGNAVSRLRIVGKCGLEVLFQIVLDIAVDGQHKRVAVGRRNVLLGFRHNVLILCILHANQSSGGAGQFIVVLGFQTVCAVVVAADISQHRRQEGAVLIVPLGIRLGVDAGAVCRFELLIQLLGYVLIDLLRDNFVLRVRLLDLLHHGIVINSQRFGQDGRKRLLLTFRRDALLDLALVHNGLRIDRNALYGGGFSQNLHIRVVDLAAVGRDERVARLQRRRLLHIEIVIEYLHIQQPHAYQPETDQCKQHGQPADTRAHLMVGSLNCHLVSLHIVPEKA